MFLRVTVLRLIYDIVSVCIDRFRLDQKLSPPFLPSLKTHTLSPFSLNALQEENTYKNSKYIFKLNRSIDLETYILQELLVHTRGQKITIVWLSLTATIFCQIAFTNKTCRGRCRGPTIIIRLL